MVLPAGEGGPGADTALVDVGAGGGRVVKFAGGLEPAVEEPMAVAESEVPDSQVGCQLENLAALSSDSRAVIESPTTRTSVTMPYATPSARPMSSFGRRKAARGRAVGTPPQARRGLAAGFIPAGPAVSITARIG